MSITTAPGIYRESGEKAFTFKKTNRGGYDIRIAGYANYGWLKEDAFWNYASTGVLNLIGNYRHSFIMPLIVQMIALYDCEMGSGAKQDSKWFYQSDRLIGYMAGYNSAQYAIGMVDSWFPFLGVLDQSIASVMKGVQQKRNPHSTFFDDQGSSEGWLIGFALGTISHLLYKTPKFDFLRVLIGVLPGAIPAIIHGKKIAKLEESIRGFGGGGV